MSEVVRVDSAPVGIDRTERHRRLSLRGFWISAAAVVLALMGVTLFSSGAICLAGYVPFIAALICLMGVLSPSGRAILVPGTLTVEQGVLHVSPNAATVAFVAQQIPLTDIVQGFWQAPSLVHLVLRSGEAVVVSLPREDGERLLSAAGVAARERVLRVPLASIASRVPGLAGVTGVVAGFLGVSAAVAVVVLAHTLHDIVTRGASLGDALAPWLVLTSLVAASSALFALVQRREVVVGGDGVRYRRFFRTRVVRHADVARAIPYAAGVQLERRDGSVVRLRTRAAGAVDAEARRAVLLDRIHQAMSADAGVDVASVSLERLDRGERSFATWRVELGKLLSDRAGYRSVGLSAAELGAVIEDAAAPAARRIAAVVALGAALPDEARRRVRIVTPACADEELQRALAQAAEGEIDEALVEREEREERATHR